MGQTQEMDSIGLRRRGMMAGLLAAPLAARAQTWPAGPLRIIVPFGPGGSTDIMGRLLASGLSPSVGVPVLVENRGGAATAMGTELAAHAAPDGQNWMVTSDSFAVLPALMPRLAVDVMRDFAPVTLIASAPNVIAVHPSRPWRSLAEIIAAARGGQLSYASTGNGTTGHLAMTRFCAALGIRMAHAAYRSGGLALNDSVAGHVDMIIGSAALLAPQIADGRLRPVVQLSTARLPALDNVQTSAEAGFADFLAETWWGVLGPARTPAPAIAAMLEAVRAVFRDERIAGQVTQTQQARLRLDGPEAMRDFLQGQVDSWGAVIRQHGISAD
jgi:tripartite-type tricarboxylate transporter receptor subunit TctC